MARLKGGSLGRTSGKLGNKVYRVMNGKNFVSYRPDKYNISQSKAAVSHRAKFSVMIEFAKYINSIPTIKQIWNAPRIKGTTSFNRIVMYNSKFVCDKSPTVNNIITPSNGIVTKNIIHFPFNNFHFSKEAGIIKIVMMNRNNAFVYNQNYTITFVLMCKEPKRKTNKYFTLDHFEESYSIDKNLSEINIELNEELIGNLNKYKKIIIYFSASRKVEGRLKYTWSSSFAKEFSIE